MDTASIDWLAMQQLERLPEFLAALAIGLLVGLERERNPRAKGGLRTFALIALAVMAIEHKQCEVALISYADNPRSGNRAFFERARDHLLAVAEVQARSRHTAPPRGAGGVSRAGRWPGRTPAWCSPRRPDASPRAQARQAVRVRDWCGGSPPWR